MPNPKGLIFTAESIRAMLAGTKTQTRRLSGLWTVNVRPIIGTVGSGEWDCEAQHVDGIRLHYGWPHIVVHTENQGDRLAAIKCPWNVGDQIYAKETYSFDNVPECINYKATSHPNVGVKWHSSLFMPQWAARPELFRTITKIRCKRVQDISEEDIYAEGIRGDYIADAHTCDPASAMIYFTNLWNSLHAKPRAVRGNSKWAKVLGWTTARTKNGHILMRQPTNKDIVGYVSLPFSEEDGDFRKTISGKPHFRCVNPWCWVLQFGERKAA